MPHSKIVVILLKQSSLGQVMIGRITGKVTTLQFSFEVAEDVRKFEYVKVPHKVYEWVLCQVVEVERTASATLAKCHILGYLKDGKVRQVRIPFEVGSEVFLADDDFIREVISLDTEQGAYLGKLDGKSIDVHLDLNRMLTKHVAVLAKSGAGKSYAVGVLLEEILERKVPVLIIDTHGEYGSLATPNDDSDERRLARYGVTPKKYAVREYGDPKDPSVTPLRLPNNLTQQELVHLLPGKLNNTQLGILLNAIRGLDSLTFESVILNLEQEESNAKWSIINLVEHLRSLGIFSPTPVSYNELLRSGSASIINMRGIPPEIQQVIVYKLAKDLFKLRKQNKVPPFFLVLEEAHNYCPERSFGEVASSKILRTIASEGRKFGLGLCVVSQRPARVDKSVLSQCTTQLILKVTNPNDVKAVSNSVEGITAESEAEIQNLPIGTALVTGVVDMPLFVNIRPRRSKHGGDAVNILEQKEDFLDKAQEFDEQELLPVITPRTSLQDLKLMADGEVTGERTLLVPAYLFACKEKEKKYNILVDMTSGGVVTDLDEGKAALLPDLSMLSRTQVRILMQAPKLGQFTKERLIQALKANADVEEDLHDLVENGYLSEETGAYSLTDRFILSKLSKYAVYAPVEYAKVQGEQLEATSSLDEVKAQLARFTTVLDQQECNLVRYELEIK